jgi:hypothetical protein
MLLKELPFLRRNNELSTLESKSNPHLDTIARFYQDLDWQASIAYQ